MATAFGYVEREADSYVNWADVGRNMSATIDNIQRVRDEKKALIEKAYNEDLDYIQSRPSGEHETLNAWSLNFGNTSAENLKLKYSQLKQGKISVNDFVRFRQNLSDSVEKIYTVNSQLQEAFKKVNDRTKAGDNQEIERATKVLLEKYGALENTLPYVNGLTGSVAIGLTEITKDADGKEVRKLRQGDDAYLTPQQLQAASMQEFNNFDPEPVLLNWVKGFGKVKESIRSVGGESFSGMITSIEDIKGDRWIQIAEENKLSEAQIKQIKGFIDDFKKSEDLFIDGVLGNEFDASAILTEKMGTVMIDGQPVPYEVVFNESEQTSEDKLYVEKTKEGKFIPRFDTEIGKKQKDALRGYLRSQLTPKYDRVIEQQTYAEQRKERPVVQGGNYDAREAGERKSYIDQFEMYHKLFTGDFDVKQTILQNFKQAAKVQSDETSYNSDTGELIITPSDPDKEKIVFNFKNPPVGVDTRDLVFSMMNLIDPALNSKYGAYAKSVPIKPINTNLPIDKKIQTAQENLDFLKKEKEKGGFLSYIYAGQIPDAEKTLKDLMDEQKRMRANQGQGGTQGGGGGSGVPGGKPRGGG